MKKQFKKLIQKYRYALPILIVSVSLVTSVVGFQLAQALFSNQTPAEETGSIAKIPGTPNTTTPEKAKEAEKVATKEAEKKAEEKKATEAAATVAAQAQAAAAASAAPATSTRINVKSPAGRSIYNDAASKAGRPAELAGQPTGIWLGGWISNIQQYVNNVTSAAYAQGTIPSFVLYNIPNRDCGSYSAGGAGSSDSYRAWVRNVAAGIGGREAMVIVEPDALSQMTDCLSAASQNQRYADISDAVNVLTTTTNSFVYLDAGNSSWIGSDEMVRRLEKANVGQARGFSMNVSGFETTSSTIGYGERISAKIKKSYVIDTSRNGQGPNGGEWCNPRGRGLGKKPAIVVSGNLDAYMWIKIPGESDGECNGGPSAGTYWDDYAQELIRNAVY